MPAKKAPLNIATNAQLWTGLGLDSKYPNFNSWTSKGTKDLFSEKGFEMIKSSNTPQALDDFFNLSVQFYLQFIDRLDVKDPFLAYDFGEVYDVPYGSIVQRLAGTNYKPISPAYSDKANLKDGTAPTPFIRRNPVIKQRFFEQNFDYQNTITVPDDFRFKVIFAEPTGMGDYIVNVILKGLQNAYEIQKFENKLEALNALINSTSTPMTDTQKISWTCADINNPTEDELRNLVGLVNETATLMTIGPTSSAWNALGYDSVQDKSRLRLLVRVPILTALNTIPKLNLPAGYSENDKLNLGLPVVPVRNFGGLKAYKDSEYTTPLYPVYDELGAVIGYAETAGATEVSVNTEDVKWKDPNEHIQIAIADKGVIFEGRQNPMRIDVQPNYRMLERYYWANAPHNTIAADALYNFVTISNGSAA